MSEIIDDELRAPTLAYVAKLEARIVVLEAALRGLLKANEQTDDAREIARAELAPEQDK